MLVCFLMLLHANEFSSVACKMQVIAVSSVKGCSKEEWYVAARPSFINNNKLRLHSHNRQRHWGWLNFF